MENMNIMFVNQIKIRKAQTKDRTQVNKLSKELSIHHNNQMPSIYKVINKAFTKEKFKEIITNKKYYMIVAETNNQIVGFAYMEIIKQNDSKIVGSKIGYLSSICVKKEYKRYGIGKQLSDNVINYAKALKNKRLINRIECRIAEWNEASKKMTSKNKSMKPLYTIYEVL